MMNDVINADFISPPNSSSTTTSAIGIVIKKKKVEDDDGECDRSYKDYNCIESRGAQREAITKSIVRCKSSCL